MNRVAVALVLALLGGCAGVDAHAPLPPPAGNGKPVALALPAFKLDYQPTDAKHLSPSRYLPLLDAENVRARTAALLRERGTASNVLDKPSPNGTHQVDVSITDAHIEYVGQGGILPLKIVFTVFFFPFDVPNYFISSDEFALVTKAKWKLKDPAGKLVAEGVAQGRETGTFGDTTRGWYFVGYLRMPTCLDAESWDDLATELVPGGEQGLAEALATSCEKALQPR